MQWGVLTSFHVVVGEAGNEAPAGLNPNPSPMGPHPSHTHCPPGLCPAVASTLLTLCVLPAGPKAPSCLHTLRTFIRFYPALVSSRAPVSSHLNNSLYSNPLARLAPSMCASLHFLTVPQTCQRASASGSLQGLFPGPEALFPAHQGHAVVRGHLPSVPSLHPQRGRCENCW